MSGRNDGTRPMLRTAKVATSKLVEAAVKGYASLIYVYCPFIPRKTLALNEKIGDPLDAWLK